MAKPAKGRESDATPTAARQSEKIGTPPMSIRSDEDSPIIIKPSTSGMLKKPRRDPKK